MSATAISTAENRQMSQWNMAPNLLSGAAHSGFREADGRMFNEYGSGHSVIDTNAAISQLPFKPTMTRGYATDLRSQGQWYLNEADKIENGTSTSWTSSKGQFGSAVTATSDVTGARRESGSRASDTHNVGGNVVVEGAKGSSTRDVTNNDLILREGNSRNYSDFENRRTFGSSLGLGGRLGGGTEPVRHTSGAEGKGGKGTGLRFAQRKCLRKKGLGRGFSASSNVQHEPDNTRHR
jgi:conjugal transfer mating pair stabilization protein TraG